MTYFKLKDFLKTFSGNQNKIQVVWTDSNNTPLRMTPNRCYIWEIRNTKLLEQKVRGWSVKNDNKHGLLLYIYAW